MRHARFDSQQQPHRLSRLTRHLTAWSLATLLVGMAGCGSSSKGPIQPNGDIVAPTVSATNPVDGGSGVAVITASFSEPMNSLSLMNSFTLSGPGGVAVYGSVAYDAAADLATFTPVVPLQLNTEYTATVTTGATDLAGNALVSNHVWRFTTGAAASSQNGVPLGAAAQFAVLAGSTVTNTGATALTGDMGVSPGSVLAGFPPGTLTGTKHVADVTSAAGMAALTIAYNDAAGRTLAPITVAGNLGGLTLPPGLYKSTSSLAITSGDLTLDARGDANGVFIFQMASTLTTTAGRAVILSGGARASNVFWQVGTSAALGTTSAFKGTIMADQSISLNTGASLNGRALARIGAVTLAGNAVVMPTP